LISEGFIINNSNYSFLLKYRVEFQYHERKKSDR
jgi:hypothetical protein